MFRGCPCSRGYSGRSEMLGMRPMELIRKTEAEFKHFAGADELTDTQLIDLMRLYPR